MQRRGIAIEYPCAVFLVMVVYLCGVTCKKGVAHKPRVRDFNCSHIKKKTITQPYNHLLWFGKHKKVVKTAFWLIKGY